MALGFEGLARFVRFRDVRPAPALTGLIRGAWAGPSHGSWRTSLDQAEYLAGVEAIRAEIAAGEVYQVNLCRLLSAEMETAPGGRDLAALAAAVARGNPAPYSMVLDVPEADLRIVGASPELFLAREGDLVRSGPIKGTGRTTADLREKDYAENVMIVDLMRHDLGQVARPGGVKVSSLCAVERHPGLVHLVSTVEAQLAPGTGWPELLAATMPPGSVSGAPKSSALRIIGAVEPVPRGLYCGAMGWVDADNNRARLCVTIRTFWLDGDRLLFGTGAGITWGSDPTAEWHETELKACRLLSLASRFEERGRHGVAPGGFARLCQQ